MDMLHASSSSQARIPTIYSPDFLKTMLPNVEQDLDAMNVDELDRCLGMVDRSVRRITNSMRTVRKEIMSQAKCEHLAPECRFRLGSVFALAGLHSVLEENLHFRERVVYARSRAEG